MRRTLLLFVTLMIAFVPVVNDVCDLGCDLRAARAWTVAAGPACPHHPHDGGTPNSQAPVPCGHDHTVGRAGLLRAFVFAPQPVALALMVSPCEAADHLSGSAASPTVLPHAPPLRAARPDVLRI
jgi:hypothetical protein